MLRNARSPKLWLRLPNTAANQERMEWLATAIRTYKGQASVPPMKRNRIYVRVADFGVFWSGIDIIHAVRQAYEALYFAPCNSCRSASLRRESHFANGKVLQ